MGKRSGDGICRKKKSQTATQSSLMKQLLTLILIIIIIVSCNDKKKEVEKKDSRIYLQRDTLNVVKLADTMVINESTCRGCAYESSTAFAIKDSLDVVKLKTVETLDNNSPDMAGGSISKLLILVPVKTGTTNVKMYKFWKGVPSEMNDSLPFTTYKIEVQN
jgi:hypothetical protein